MVTNVLHEEPKPLSPSIPRETPATTKSPVKTELQQPPVVLVKPGAKHEASSLSDEGLSDSNEDTASGNESSSSSEASAEEGKLESVSVISSSLLIPEERGRWLTVMASLLAISLAVTLFSVLYMVLKEGG
ncbi:hypothetical protein MTO96_029224 [Rhipicephalus appendiculatus]